MARGKTREQCAEMGKQTQFTPANANEMRERGLIVRRDNAARNAWFDEYTDLALTLAGLSSMEFEQRFAHPETKREEILLWQFSDPAQAYKTLKDFQERVQGTPKQMKEVKVDAPKGLTISVNSEEVKEAIENLV